MNRYTLPQNRRSPRKGVMYLMFAGGIVALCGFAALAVDYGVLVNDKNHLQRVCDAAALGGATKLTDTTAAKNTAILVAGQNRFTVDSRNRIEVTFPAESNNTRIRVEAWRDRPLFFARVLGQYEGKVRAHAIATVNSSSPGVAPVGITTTSYNSQNPIVSGNRRKYDFEPSPIFTTRFINRQHEAFDPNEFMLFDLRDPEAKSPSKMMNQLKGLDEVNIKASDNVGALDYEATSLNARNQDDFFEEGMTHRFQSAAGSPWLDIDSTKGSRYIDYVGQHFTQIYNGTEPLGNGNPFTQNPRVMSLIITNPLSTAVKGTYNAPVVDLAPVYVVSLRRVGGEMLMDYRYLPRNGGGGGSGTLFE